MRKFSPKNLVIIAKSQGLIKLIMLLDFFQRLVSLIRKELRSPVRHSISKTLWLWKQGFLSDSSIFYSLETSNVTQYVSDYSLYFKTPLINKKYSFVLNNKLIFSKMLQNYQTHLVTIYCLVQEGKILPIDKSTSLNTLEDVIELCRRQKILVIKPTSGALGEGVHFFSAVHDQFFLNHSPLSFSEATQLLLELDDYIISEYIQQHDYAATIFPDSTNTLRILTMWDYDRNMPFIATAMHRFGRTTTIPVDN